MAVDFTMDFALFSPKQGPPCWSRSRFSSPELSEIMGKTLGPVSQSSDWATEHPNAGGKGKPNAIASSFSH